MSYLTDGSNDRIQYVVDSGAVPLLVRLLTQSTLNVVTPALRAVGNIVTGSDLQTDAVIEAGGIQAVGSLLIHEKMNVVKEAAWTISNITAGPPEQIQIIIGSGILPPLIEVLKNGDFRAKKEAAWAVTNLTSGKLIKCSLRSHFFQSLVFFHRRYLGTNCGVVYQRSDETFLRFIGCQ